MIPTGQAQHILLPRFQDLHPLQFFPFRSQYMQLITDM